MAISNRETGGGLLGVLQPAIINKHIMIAVFLIVESHLYLNGIPVTLYIFVVLNQAQTLVFDGAGFIRYNYGDIDGYTKQFTFGRRIEL
jgi:hypothetical protein